MSIPREATSSGNQSIGSSRGSLGGGSLSGGAGITGSSSRPFPLGEKGFEEDSEAFFQFACALVKVRRQEFEEEAEENRWKRRFEENGEEVGEERTRLWLLAVSSYIE